MPDAPPLRGLVLAGGRSVRLGTDKAAVAWDGEALLSRAVAELERVVAGVHVAVRADQRDDPLRARFRCLVDRGEGIGPAAGLLAAQAAFPGDAWLVLACDMPRVTAPVLAALVAARDPARAGVAFRGGAGPEPLCALYEPATLAAFRRQVEAGGPASPRGWLATVDPVLLDAPPPGVLDSVNEPGDLARLAPEAARRLPPAPRH